MIKLFIIFACISSLLGCATLKEQYESRSYQIREYCKSIFKDAGYGDKIYKKSMAKYLSKTEDREQIRQQLQSIALFLISISFGITLKASPF